MKQLRFLSLAGLVVALAIPQSAQAKPRDIELNPALRVQFDKFVSDFAENPMHSFSKNALSARYSSFSVSVTFFKTRANWAKTGGRPPRRWTRRTSTSLA